MIPYEVGPHGQCLMYSWRVQASALMRTSAPSAEGVKRAIDGHLDAHPCLLSEGAHISLRTVHWKRRAGLCVAQSPDLGDEGEEERVGENTHFRRPSGAQDVARSRIFPVRFTPGRLASRDETLLVTLFVEALLPDDSRSGMSPQLGISHAANPSLQPTLSCLIFAGNPF